jgi:polar amino acid transport system substrate-binding protein
MVLCLLILFFCSSALADEPPMRINYTDFWPFYSRNESSEVTGLLHDIVSQALERMGVSATWHEFPWGRCQSNVRSGDADAMITVPTKDRLAYAVTHHDPLYMKERVIFTYAGNPKLKAIESISSIDDILSADLTVITYVGNGWNKAHVRSRGIKTYVTPQRKQVWLMLAQKRGDLVLEWPGGAWPEILEQGLGQSVVQTCAVLQAVPFHLLIRRDSPYARVLPGFNLVIGQMRRDGTIGRIVDSYGGQSSCPP